LSTKIYTGFRLTTSDWAAIHDHVMEFRRELEEATYRERCRRVAVSACWYLDRVTLGLADPAEDSPYTSAYMDDMDDLRKDSARFDIVFIPHGREVYGMTFGDEMPEKLWFAKDFVSEYGYWNNTDRPDHLTDEEWEDRAETWDAMLPGSPAMSGFTAQCLPKYARPIALDHMMPELPSREFRARRMAIDLLFPKFVDEKRVEPIQAYGSFMDWIRAEGKERFEAEVGRIGAFLAADVTKEMLTGPAKTRRNVG